MRTWDSNISDVREVWKRRLLYRRLRNEWYGLIGKHFVIPPLSIQAFVSGAELNGRVRVFALVKHFSFLDVEPKIHSNLSCSGQSGMRR